MLRWSRTLPRDRARARRRSSEWQECAIPRVRRGCRLPYRHSDALWVNGSTPRRSPSPHRAKRPILGRRRRFVPDTQLHRWSAARAQFRSLRSEFTPGRLRRMASGCQSIAQDRQQSRAGALVSFKTGASLRRQRQTPWRSGSGASGGGNWRISLDRKEFRILEQNRQWTHVARRQKVDWQRNLPKMHFATGVRVRRYNELNYSAWGGLWTVFLAGRLW
jgi:hypothetical protein